MKINNTFGIDAQAKNILQINSEEELVSALKKFPDPIIIGGGSNILLTENIEKPVFQIRLKGIEIEKENDDFVWVKANAGEVWHEFVLFCLEKGYGGIENLSLIPGNVGTSPVQNIGAYGVEIKDVMETCEAINLHTSQKRSFSNAECKFSYRESIFKNEEKGNYIIVSVTFKLTKRNHKLHTEYGIINQILAEKGITSPTPTDVSNAVIQIRTEKLPDPNVIGNGGSFFKNPIIQKADLETLTEKYPTIPFYEIDENHAKIPAGWLIETAGLKGYRIGNAGVHSRQALVLVNYGNATGKEILDLANFVKNTILEKFNIELSFEVNIF